MTDEKKETVKRAFFDEPNDVVLSPTRKLIDKIKVLAFPIAMSIIVTLSTVLIYLGDDLVNEVHATHDDVLIIKTQNAIIIPDLEARISTLEGQVKQLTHQQGTDNSDGSNNSFKEAPTANLVEPLIYKNKNFTYFYSY